MTDHTPDKIKNLLEITIKRHDEAFIAQTGYFDDLIKRHTACFAAMAATRADTLRAIYASLSFNEAFEENAKYEDTVRESLQALHEANQNNWEDLQRRLNALYTVEDDAKQAVRLTAAGRMNPA